MRIFLQIYGILLPRSQDSHINGAWYSNQNIYIDAERSFSCYLWFLSIFAWSHHRVNAQWYELPCGSAALGVTVASSLNPPAPHSVSQASAAAAAAAARSVSVTIHRTQRTASPLHVCRNGSHPIWKQRPRDTESNLTQSCWVCVLHVFQFIKMNFNISICHACCSRQRRGVRRRDDVQQAEGQTSIKDCYSKIDFL